MSRSLTGGRPAREKEINEIRKSTDCTTGKMIFTKLRDKNVALLVNSRKVTVYPAAATLAMALPALSGRIFTEVISMPGTDAALSRVLTSSQEVRECTSRSIYSPLLVSPTPKGAAKDMI